ncbi:hypothetical protein SMSP2_01909 [Limihaloglobus sulfuriphilus]|uniref:Uncharacterized protein n=1 Tax=Limihaloglobus sulfuriphilus TaxID=1851148 RepID=A0A1Q2MFP9_9BACT|nr:hypothetical protein [Limihaloglobus sulfuriphilus]AQQ71535.1 hypothetical protein SMSP2_01909 [Limihaloglobus sulfuriphilus]
MQDTENSPNDPPRHSFIDYFLYPFSTAGAIQYLVIVLVLTGLNFLARFLAWIPFIGFAFMIVGVVVTYWLIWYWEICAVDSSNGGVRAPDTNDQLMGMDFEIWSVVSRYMYFVFYLVVWFVPAIGWFIYNKHQADLLTYALVGAGCFFLPMTLMRYYIYEDVTIINPLAVLWDIIKTLPGYLVVFAFFAGAFWAVIWFVLAIDRGSLAAMVTLYPAIIYISIVLSHVMGRHCYSYRKRLNW